MAGFLDKVYKALSSDDFREGNDQNEGDKLRSSGSKRARKDDEMEVSVGQQQLKSSSSKREDDYVTIKTSPSLKRDRKDDEMEVSVVNDKLKSSKSRREGEYVKLKSVDNNYVSIRSSRDDSAGDSLSDSFQSIVLNDGFSIVVGPVIGKVTHDSARILFEVDADVIECCCLLKDTQSNLVLTVTKKLFKNKPGVFVFTNLPPERAWTVEIPTASNHSERIGSFRTYSPNMTSMKIASLSCNSMTEPEEPVLWDDLIQKHIDTKDVDLVLHIGDQVYADAAFKKGIELLHSRGVYDPNNGSEDLKNAITEFYREIYRKTWNYPPTRKVLANVPNLTIWDDHDVRDDWGTHLTDFDTSTPEYFVGLAARRAYHEYQRQLWDDVLDSNGNPVEVTVECHLHRFGSVGIMFIDSRGSRSFFRDTTYPCLSIKQWETLRDSLDEKGIYEETKCLVVVSSIALCLAGPEMSKKAALVFPRDKMGFGLFPEEQLDFIKLLHKWKTSKPSGERSLVVIGGDLHMGVQTEIYHNDDFLFQQFITSPIKQHPPPNIAFLGMKGVMKVREILKDGYHFKHSLIEGARNFGIIYCDAESIKANIRAYIYFRKQNNNQLYLDPAFSTGEIEITDIELEDIGNQSNFFSQTSKIYMEFKIGKKKRKLKPIDWQASNNKWAQPITMSLVKSDYLEYTDFTAGKTPELTIKVYQLGSVADSTVAQATTSILELTKGLHPKSVTTHAVSLPFREQGSIKFNFTWRPFY